jgi:hypothetical protein
MLRSPRVVSHHGMANELGLCRARLASAQLLRAGRRG